MFHTDQFFRDICVSLVPRSEETEAGINFCFYVFFDNFDLHGNLGTAMYSVSPTQFALYIVDIRDAIFKELMTKHNVEEGVCVEIMEYLNASIRQIVIARRKNSRKE